MFISIIYFFLLSVALGNVYETFTFGRPGLIFPTFVYALLVDQVKSFIFLSFIYAIVVRRFMYLEVNEHDYFPLHLRPPNQEDSIPRLRIFCLKFIESDVIETFLYIVIGVYTVFTLLNLMNN